jgi:hypothetical protein
MIVRGTANKLKQARSVAFERTRVGAVDGWPLSSAAFREPGFPYGES